MHVLGLDWILTEFEVSDTGCLIRSDDMDSFESGSRIRTWGLRLMCSGGWGGGVIFSADEPMESVSSA